MTELQEHVKLAKYIKDRYPNVIFLSTLNGVRMPIGLSVQCAALQSSRGLPDIVIFKPMGGFHGLCIELKKTGEKLFKKDGETFISTHLEEQNNVLTALKKQDYFATFCIGYEDARKMVDRYMRF